MTNDQLQVYYENFPAVLKMHLKRGTFCFPNGVEFDYEPKEAYRAVIRKVGEENTPVNLKDMKSYYEQGKVPRGVSDDKLSPQYFAVSLFENIEMLKRNFDFSNPRKLLAKGYVFREGGPSLKGENSHISWWLFEGVDFSNFEIMEKENE